MDDHLWPRPAYRLGDLIGIKRVRDHRHRAQLVEHRLLRLAARHGMNLMTGGNQTRHQLHPDRSCRARDKHSHRQLLDRGSPPAKDKTTAPAVTPLALVLGPAVAPGVHPAWPVGGGRADRCQGRRASGAAGLVDGRVGAGRSPAGQMLLADKNYYSGEFERALAGLQRLLALTAVIWHNDKTGQTTPRSLIAYDH